MKKIIIALLLLSLLLGGCGEQTKAHADEMAEKIFYVKTEKPIFQAFENKIILPGTLTPKDEGVITAKVSGVIEKINSDIGNQVELNEVLCEIEPETYTRTFKKAELAYENITNTYNRMIELYEKEAVSKSEFESLQTQYNSLKEDYELAKLNLEYSKIKAPLSGIISSKEVLIGQGVSPGMELFRVVDISELYVETGVTERDIENIKEGQKVNVITENGDSYTGKVVIIGPVPDINTGTYPIKVLVDNENYLLKAGMFVDIEVIINIKEKALSIDKNAVIEEDEIHYVYVASNKIAHKTKVEIGMINKDRVEILSGIDEKDEVVVSGQNKLRDQSKIEIGE